MRPLAGWVIDDCGPETSIKLKTGPIIRVPHREDLRWGDPAYIFYDHESAHIRDVLSFDQIMEDAGSEEIPWHKFDTPWELPTPEELVDYLSR